MSLEMRHLFFSILLVLGSVDANTGKKINKYVTTRINAKWKETPILLEVAEYLSDKNPNLFWKFVDAVVDSNDDSLVAGTDKRRYDGALELAGRFLSSMEMSVLKLALSLRVNSARVRMFSQMAENKNNSCPDCRAFADVNGEFARSPDELENLIDRANEDREPINVYGVDHRYPGVENSTKTVVLYGEIGTREFGEFHEKLKFLAESKNIGYILRHCAKDRSDRRVRLSGYGVELQMKSTEYKATDDSDIKETGKGSETVNEGVEETDGINFSVLKNLYPDKHAELDKFQAHLSETSDNIGALKVWQFQELSHQAAERIMSSPPGEALNVLTDIAQNFPMRAKSLIRIKVSEKMIKEMKHNQDVFSSVLNVPPSSTVLLVNGLSFELESIDVISLLESFRGEVRVMEALHKIGFGRKKIDKLLALDLSSDLENQDFAIDIRDSAILWTNDIENDPRYSRWTFSLNNFLPAIFMGTRPDVRRNLYNLVFVIDPTSESSKACVSFAEGLFSVYPLPLRVGFVFVTNSDESLTGSKDAGVAINNAYHYFIEEKGPMGALYFLQELTKYYGPRGIDVDSVKRAIRARDRLADVEDILGEDSEYDVGRRLASDFVKRTGFKKFPQALMNGVPFSIADSDTESIREAVDAAMEPQTMLLQKGLFSRELTDSHDVVTFVMSQPNVMPRLNAKVLQTEKIRWLNLIGTVPNDDDYASWSSEDTAAWLISNSNYLSVPRRTSVRHLYSFWVVTDLETETGRKLLREALDYLESNADVRMTIIVNSLDDSNPGGNAINKIALAALKTLAGERATSYVARLTNEETVETIENGNFDFQEDGVKAAVDEQDLTLKVHRRYAQNAIELEASERAVVCNGRLVGPFDEDEEFTSDDFALFERFSQALYGEKLSTNLIKLGSVEDDDDDDYEKSEISDDMIMQISPLLVQRPQTRRRYEIPAGSYEYSSVNIGAANPDAVAFDLTAIVDPVSRGAQKLGTILSTIQKTLNCNMRIFLNCAEKNSDMPLKSFYRFVFEPELRFTSDGQLSGAMAKFTKLPTSSLLTQYIHAPENWLVEVVKSAYDLDNIKLDNAAMGVDSEFELEHLLLEGHCFEASMASPPRGLQITLGTESRSTILVDTIVMANLGYFQLKANPGEWILQLRQGRSAEIYDIASVGGQDIVQNGNRVRVVMGSLRSNVLKLKVSKKPEKADMDLLWEDDKSSGLWNSISRTFTNADEASETEERLNIFSLASGHLYERFLKIMMLSVVKHTETPVKFWFLKNYLSPTLKNFLPRMAKEYGFEYELVQYKWPRWLHQQTEKQRTIWGYKILFLDVLFPLDVKKIIFVDADQVVRADLKELASLDLEGAPYAYPPFCDSRKEMDGFRFWRQGYWRSHLQGRTYHISALYVVDLKRFRRIAAGDRLRGQYQALSQDPNSLSNLDQDLPNNMIHQVAIKTLPQEWLWCETWCDDGSKKYAKTIDLCNNPMTKEAKLQAAMRILPEWTGYDEEIKALQQRAENENGQLEGVEKNEEGTKEASDEKDTDEAAEHEEL